MFQITFSKIRWNMGEIMFYCHAAIYLLWSVLMIKEKVIILIFYDI